MTIFQRIKSLIAGIIVLIFAVVLVYVPEQTYILIPIILGLYLLIKGINQLVYY